MNLRVYGVALLSAVTLLGGIGNAGAVESWEPTVQLAPTQCGTPPTYPSTALASGTTGLVRLTLELDQGGHVTNHWVRAVPKGDKPSVRALVMATVDWAQSCQFPAAADSEVSRRTSLEYVWRTESP